MSRSRPKLGLPNTFPTNRLHCFLNLVQERQAAVSNVHCGDKPRVLGTFGQWQWASRPSALPPDGGSPEAVPHWSLPGLGRLGQVGDWSWAILRQTEAMAREVSLAWSQQCARMQWVTPDISFQSGAWGALVGSTPGWTPNSVFLIQ